MIPRRYIIGLDQVTDLNHQAYEDLYLQHYGIDAAFHNIQKTPEEIVVMLREFYDAGVLRYYSSAKLYTGEICCSMGILMERLKDRVYVFTHLVTHEEHRRQGLAEAVLKQGTGMLKAIGAQEIRNHKRMNVIPGSYFDAMGFKREDYKIAGMPAYEWRYTWRSRLGAETNLA